MDSEAMDFAPAHLDKRKAALARSAKRYLTKGVMRCRGCHFCADMVRVTREYIALVEAPEVKVLELKKGSSLYFCRHEACPYRELDAVKKDYIEEYDKVVAQGQKTIMEGLKRSGKKKAKKGEAA